MPAHCSQPPAFLTAGELAAALYVACGELCGPPGTFVPAAWQTDEWQRLAALLPGIVKYRPEKLLSRASIAPAAKR